MNKEQALKRVDELEAKVDVFVKGSDALEKRAMDLARGLDAEVKRADNLLAEKNDLQRKLDGYGDLAKALGKIRGENVSPDLVREIVKEEVAKVPVGSNPTIEGVEVTESVPYVNLKVSSPWLTLDETTIEGRVSVLALSDKLPTQFHVSDVQSALETHYSWRITGGKQRNRLKEALDELVGKYKLLERIFNSHDKQYVYTVRKDAESRVKESETHEAVEIKE